MKFLTEKEVQKMQAKYQDFCRDQVCTGEVVYYIGKLNLDVGVTDKTENGTNELKIYKVPGESNYILRLEKLGNYFRETTTGFVFKTYEDTRIDGNWDNVETYFLPKKTYFLLDNSFYKENTSLNKAYFKFIARNPNFSNYLKKYSSYVEEYMNVYYRELFFCSTESKYEEAFYREHIDKLEFYSNEPKIGDYFGYMGNIYTYVPKELVFDDEKTKCMVESQKISVCKIPMFLKLVDYDTAIDVMTGNKFSFRDDSGIVNVNNGLLERKNDIHFYIDRFPLIKANKYFEILYGGLSKEKIDDFKTEINDLKFLAKMEELLAFDRCMKESFVGLRIAYELAQLDNLLYDIDNPKSLKKVDGDNN